MLQLLSSKITILSYLYDNLSKTKNSLNLTLTPVFTYKSLPNYKDSCKEQNLTTAKFLSQRELVSIIYMDPLLAWNSVPTLILFFNLRTCGGSVECYTAFCPSYMAIYTIQILCWQVTSQLP